MTMGQKTQEIKILLKTVRNEKKVKKRMSEKNLVTPPQSPKPELKCPDAPTKKRNAKIEYDRILNPVPNPVRISGAIYSLENMPAYLEEEVECPGCSACVTDEND